MRERGEKGGGETFFFFVLEEGEREKLKGTITAINTTKEISKFVPNAHDAIFLYRTFFSSLYSLVFFLLNEVRGRAKHYFSIVTMLRGKST